MENINSQVVTTINKLGFLCVVRAYWDQRGWWMLFPTAYYRVALDYPTNAWHQRWIFEAITAILTCVVGFQIAGGGISLWLMSYLLVLPYILLRGYLVGVQTITFASVTIPLSGTLWEVARAEREHKLAEKIEKVIEKISADKRA